MDKLQMLEAENALLRISGRQKDDVIAALKDSLVELQADRYREQGMRVEQAQIHAKCDVERRMVEVLQFVITKASPPPTA